MKTGRNEPCPCGSGKKFKKCCYMKEKADMPNLTHHNLRRTADTVAGVLVEYARSSFGPHFIDNAWEDFWDDVPPEEYDESISISLFLPWCLYLRTLGSPDHEGDVEFPGRETIVSGYLERYRRGMDRMTEAFLEHARREPLTFWQVEAVQPGTGILVKDLVTERELFVHERMGSKSLVTWDIVLGQVVGEGEEYIMNAMGPRPLPPGRFRERVMEFVEPLRKGGPPGTTDFLAYDRDFIRFYHRCVDDMFHAPFPEVRNTDGEKLVWTTSEYSFEPSCRDELIRRLGSLRNIVRGNDESDYAAFDWIVGSTGSEGTVKGLLKVHPDHLLTECNSRTRDRKLRNRLLERLGDLLGLEETSYRDMDFESMTDLPGEEQSLNLEELTEESTAELIAYLDKQYLSWLDENVPALGGLTPREAAATAEGRRKVEELINDWENIQQRAPRQPYLFDFNRLREALGLETE